MTIKHPELTRFGLCVLLLAVQAVVLFASLRGAGWTVFMWLCTAVIWALALWPRRRSPSVTGKRAS